jgi:phosphoketolase
MLDVLCQRGNTHCRLPSDDIVQEAMMANTLSDKERSLIDAYWRAANYLSVGQIYLY